METLFAFLLKASLGIILFYLVYWFFLRNETFYKANRWFLLLTLVSSVFLPVFPVKYMVVYEPQNVTGAFKALTDAFRNSEIVSGSEIAGTANFSWQHGITLIYLTGVAIFLLRLLFQTAVLISIILKYRIKRMKGMRIVENKKYGLPFSFFNIIFINPKFHTQEDLPEILAHETVHIRENHWFDLLLIELLTVIFWFNPFIWFFERSIKQNHEYLADKGVISMGHSVARYQALLLNQLMGMQIIGVTNNLNFALNTNRLKMMTKKKTPKIKGYKFMFAIPALALLLTAFAEPEYIPAINNEASTPGQTIQGEKKFIIHGKIVEKETGEPMPGATIVIKGTGIGTVSDLDGTFTLVDPSPKNGKSDRVYTDLLVSFVGFKTVEKTISSVDDKFELDISSIKMEKGVIEIGFSKIVGGDKTPPPPPPPPPVPVKDKPGSDGEKFYIIEELPQFPGGFWELRKYVTEKIDKFSKEESIKGKAKIGFTVNSKGKVVDVKIIEANNTLTAEKAAQIATEMPDWTPGKQRGKSVPVNYILPIEF